MISIKFCAEWSYNDKVMVFWSFLITWKCSNLLKKFHQKWLYFPIFIVNTHKKPKFIPVQPAFSLLRKYWHLFTIFLWDIVLPTVFLTIYGKTFPMFSYFHPEKISETKNSLKNIWSSNIVYVYRLMMVIKTYDNCAWI